MNSRVGDTTARDISIGTFPGPTISANAPSVSIKTHHARSNAAIREFTKNNNGLEVSKSPRS